MDSKGLESCSRFFSRAEGVDLAAGLLKISKRTEFIGIKSVSHIIFMLLICKTHKVTAKLLLDRSQADHQMEKKGLFNYVWPVIGWEKLLTDYA